ncbi:protoporphyrinogen oxidase HemJ [Sulfurimonas sp.]|uniref:protoporphyrinogen oxidase HemJ n=1 Tax=Sulfurimonas sp. TaxID=2022749 RepID=UPI00260648B3|nr:protoporphyrinogen oxidase HemJ [Sulfurimonas sp.]
MLYNWILWFHVVSVISWFAVLFYLPRLYVYHVENSDNKGFIEVVKIQEMKLYKYIGVPSMWATIISGSFLIYFGNWMSSHWLHIKLLLVVILIGYFHSLGVLRIKLLEDRCTKSGKFFRFYNEVPTILMLLIVAMVVFKPF